MKTDAVEVKPDISIALRGVWGASASDIWAVGATGGVVHYDGSSWKGVDSGTTQNLLAISGTAADDIWAVGDNGVTLHYDGKAWAQADNTARQEETWMGVWAIGREDVWVAGLGGETGLLRHFSRRPDKDPIAPAYWQTLDIPGSTSLWRAWASSASDVWLVGSDKSAKGFVVRGDGKKFDKAPFEGASLRAVFGASAEDVWVGGYDGSLQHWDGKAWTTAPAIADAHWLGMWGSGANDFWVFGLAGKIYHHDGQAWTKVESGTQEVIWGAWGSAADDIWFVGGKGTRLHWKGKSFASP